MLERPIQKDRLSHFMLIAGMYQLEHMATPDHAVVNETVGSLKKRFAWARKFVNGVLRERGGGTQDTVRLLAHQYTK